jgi:peptidoglycan/xylan/chitin deacetylase (PgdA/CDA1 family)
MGKVGKLVISLDFELSWGVLDRYPNGEYNKNLLGTKTAIVKMLELFKEFDIGVTWATVGLLFNHNIDDAKQRKPSIYPNYQCSSLSNYTFLNTIESCNQDLYFANDIIKYIATFPRQEIGSHTYSHYYCLEEGQTIQQFSDDLELSKNISTENGFKIRSLIFPRNQVNEEYINLLTDMGIDAYRGNEDNWLNRPSSSLTQSLALRGLRLIDSYINLTGDNSFNDQIITNKKPLNIMGSRFLRPSKNKFIDALQKRRIINSMRSAAKKGHVYHLWWHPHNFGVDTDTNLNALRNILVEFKVLNEKYKFRSVNMKELSEILNK